MKIAVVGCAHGELETIYDTVQYLETKNSIKVDLLVCCGDFQATRNLDDLGCMAVPPKYREMCTFYKYYSGEKQAPVLTLFIGGNHEASNHLQELPYGGWVAPNIYYLGYAGVVNFGGVRIGGISGIFNGKDFCKGRFERPPYHQESLRSCYHIRNLDIFRLKQLSQPVQIMLSHDWPAHIYNHGNLEKLLKDKPYFKQDIDNDSLGSKPGEELLNHMKPEFWFSAHLHVKFAALVQHKDDAVQKTTKFLALDKCLPRRKFLQVVDVPTESEERDLMYDLEWLTILNLTNHLLSVRKVNCYLSSSGDDERNNYTPKPEDMESVLKRFKNDLKVPHNFTVTVPPYNPKSSNQGSRRLQPNINPQTVQFCEKLGIDDPISLLLNEDGLNTSNSSFSMNSFDSSSFVAPTDSELESSSSSFQGFSPLVTGRDTLRTPLKLPKPLNSSDISVDDCVTSTPYKEEVQPENDSVSVDDTEKTVDIDESASGPKKFKRRNLAMYSSNDCDA
ncbi:UNVERIFIED_CONTAM: hypothetical protein PYX00_008164 [Menopon gallinae]|uniref:Lariat debranching enzyme C-terminal domain-containing protein n=1 Tax=Menopon gallinae TaxID=328185 RepID=A0AAW2HMK8_9NEOP